MWALLFYSKEFQPLIYIPPALSLFYLCYSNLFSVSSGVLFGILHSYVGYFLFVVIAFNLLSIALWHLKV